MNGTTGIEVTARATLLDLDVPLPLVGTTVAERHHVAIARKLRASVTGELHCPCHGYVHRCPGGRYTDLSAVMPLVRAIEAWDTRGDIPT